MSKEAIVAFIRANCHQMTMKEMAEELGVHRHRIQYFSTKHGIKFRPMFTPEEDAYLREHYADTLVADIAKVLKRSESSVITRARRMGLRKSRHGVSIDPRFPSREFPEHLRGKFMIFMADIIAESPKLQKLMQERLERECEYH